MTTLASSRATSHRIAWPSGFRAASSSTMSCRPSRSSRRGRAPAGPRLPARRSSGGPSLARRGRAPFKFAGAYGLSPPPAPGRNGCQGLRVLHPGERRPLPEAAEAAGIRSWGSPSTSTASRSRSRSGITPFGERTPGTTWASTWSFPARPGCGQGSRWTGSRAGGSHRERARPPLRRLDYVVGSVHFIRDMAVDHDAYDVWEGDQRPRQGLGALLRDIRRGDPDRDV